MAKRCLLSLLLALLLLLGGCASLQPGSVSAEGYQWQVTDDYYDGDPYCFLAAQRSEEEGTWYCFVDILGRSILDITLSVQDDRIGQPTGYGFFLDEAAAPGLFAVTEEVSLPRRYLTFLPQAGSLPLEDPSAYFIGVEGSRNNTNLVILPTQVAQALDQFLIQQYGSVEAAEEIIVHYWYDDWTMEEPSEDPWSGEWEWEEDLPSEEEDGLPPTQPEEPQSPSSEGIFSTSLRGPVNER